MLNKWIQIEVGFATGNDILPVQQDVQHLYNAECVLYMKRGLYEGLSFNNF